MISDSWRSIKTETIKNCFIKAGFPINGIESISINLNDNSNLQTGIEQFQLLPNEITYNQFMNFDNNIAICDEEIDS